MLVRFTWSGELWGGSGWHRRTIRRRSRRRSIRCRRHGQGVVFVAEGRYRLSQTIHLWTGIRLVGWGAHRPVFVLAANTPGYQEGHEFLGTGRYMLQFASRRPAAGQPVVDANEFTFYSGISNLDFEIGPGNPAAIAVRFHVAQHSFLAAHAVPGGRWTGGPGRRGERRDRFAD